jgi:Plavaka transposase
METYKVVKCPDRCYRRAIFSLGPYIADYPEQVWLAGIVLNWCPKLSIHFNYHCLPTNEYLDVMQGLIILMVREVIVAHMRRQIISLRNLTRAFFGMSLGFGTTLWFVCCGILIYAGDIYFILFTP